MVSHRPETRCLSALPAFAGAKEFLEAGRQVSADCNQVGFVRGFRLQVLLELKKHLDDAEKSPKQIAAVLGLREKTLYHKPPPDEWCILEILGHLADTEICTPTASGKCSVW
jgi:hypothetical protein